MRSLMPPVVRKLTTARERVRKIREALDHIVASMVMVGKEIYGRNAWDEAEREVEEDYNADN